MITADDKKVYIKGLPFELLDQLTNILDALKEDIPDDILLSAMLLPFLYPRRGGSNEFNKDFCEQLIDALNKAAESIRETRGEDIKTDDKAIRKAFEEIFGDII
jgi:hypothetical protein